MKPLVRITVDEPHFAEIIKNFSAAGGKSISDAFRDGCRIIAAELIKHTPPFSGKMLSKMLIARGKAPVSDPDIARESAKEIGERAVARDMAKLFVKVKNWWKVKAGPSVAYLFTDASGKHYGTTLDRFNPNPTREWAESIRARFRNRRGRVAYNVKPEESPEFVNTRKYPLPELSYELLEAKLKSRVGEARGGWAASYVALGGKVSSSSWVGRHLSKGECKTQLAGDNLSVEMINRSAWASGGDQDRAIHNSTQSAAEYISREIRRRLTAHWGNKSGRAGVVDQ